MKAITEKTLVPISLVVVLIGGIIWLTQIYTTANANSDNIRDIKRMEFRYRKMLFDRLNSIDRRLAVIEGSLRGKTQD